MIRRLLINVGVGILQRLGKRIYSALWQHIFTVVVKAEEIWKEEWKSGEAKKKYVLKKVEEYLREKGIVKWYNKRPLMFLIEHTLDQLIFEFNKGYSQDWLTKAKEIKERFWRNTFLGFLN